MVMAQRRGRPAVAFDDGSGSSSDSENDAFATISKKKKPRIHNKTSPSPPTSSFVADHRSQSQEIVSDTAPSSSIKNLPPAADVSSTKRHHHVNADRQAKMDALLQELQTTQPSNPSPATAGDRGEEYYGSIHDGDSFYERDGGGNFAPQKKGSYVEPGMEHLTTNLFVGNLDPMTTEEELTDLFRQFGEDYHICLQCC